MEETIGNKPLSWLVRYIRDILEQQSVQSYQQLSAEEITVNSALILKGKVLFTDETAFRNVGGTGNAAFANSWVNYGSPYFSAGYWKDALGWVHLRGVIKSGTVGSTAFTLPPGFRPASDVGPLIVFSNGGAGRLDIKADGTVTPVSPSSNVYVVLDNIHFKSA